VGRTIIENKHTVWTFIRSRNLLVKASRQTFSKEEPNPSLLTSNYSINIEKSLEYVANRKCFIISFSSKIRHDRVVRYWIDAATGLALRTERYHSGGSLASVSYFRDVNFHPKFADGVFSEAQFKNAKIAPPASRNASTAYLSKQQIASSLGGRGFAPPSIREYRLVGVTKVDTAKIETLHLHYTDGLSSLSLFETVQTSQIAKMNGARPFKIKADGCARIASRYGYSILNWEAQRLRMTLLADASPQTLSDLSQCIIPALTSYGH
jgi:hypothetical protein